MFVFKLLLRNAFRHKLRTGLTIVGLVVAICGLASALAPNLEWLVAARFVQGLFIPALTTCLAAYLARFFVNLVCGHHLCVNIGEVLGHVYVLAVLFVLVSGYATIRTVIGYLQNTLPLVIGDKLKTS